MPRFFRRLVRTPTLLAVLLVALGGAHARSSHSRAPTPPDLRLAAPADPRMTGALEVVRWTRSTPSVEVVEGRAEPTPDTTIITIPGGCREGDVYAVRSGRVLSAPYTVEKAECSQAPVPLRLFLRADIDGRLAWPEGAEPPRRVFLDIERCGIPGRKRADPLGRYPIGVRPDGQWAVPVPADCLVMAIVTDEFAPFAFPPLNLTVGQHLDVGSTALVPSAALRASVVSQEGQRAIGGASVDLVPANDLSDVVARTLRGEPVKRLVHAKTDPDGVASLAGLAPGPAYLRVAAPNRATVFSGPLFIPKERHALIERVALPLVAQVAIRLQDAQQSIGGQGPVSVRLVPQVGLQWIETAYLEASADTDNTAVFRGVWPGTWRADVDASDGRTLVRLAQQELVVGPGESRSFEISLSRHVFHGYVSFRGAPLAARLEFEPDQDSGGARAHTTSDLDGNFEVALTRPGEYTVFVTAVDRPLSSTVADLAVADPADRLLVTLPDGRLEGVVATAQGQPAPSAVVLAKGVSVGLDPDAQLTSALLRPVGATTDSAGRFTLDGLAPGKWQLTATLGADRSDPRIVDVGPGSTGPVELRLGRAFQIVGRVVTRLGAPIVAAVGVASPVPARASEVFGVREFSTDQAGRFRVTLDRSSPGDAFVTVFPQGRAVTASRVAISGAGQVELMVPDEGGELRLHVPRTAGGPGRPPRNLIILASVEGGIVTVNDLLHYGAASLVELPHETRIDVRSLAPGIWNVVMPPSLHQGLMLLAQPPAMFPASAVFELAARGTADVSVPR